MVPEKHFPTETSPADDGGRKQTQQRRRQGAVSEWDTPADPECLGHTVMCDDIAGPFDCGNIRINRHYQQRAMSAGLHGNAPHVITKEAFQS